MEYIDILDTAVKVGLGAVISGFTTYHVSRLSHMADRKKDGVKRVYEALIFINEKLDLYMSSLSRCLSVLDGTARAGFTRATIPKVNLDQYSVEDMALVESRKDLASALSRLRLMGARDAERAILELVRFENRLRTSIIFELNIPNLAEVDQKSIEFKALRDRVFDALHQVYERQ